MLFVICFIIPALSACTPQPPQAQQRYSNPFSSFRDVPGVTEEEIADIETLQKEREYFSYGMIMSTEAFITNDGEIGGYSALLCEWLTELFGIRFQVVIHPMNVLLEKLDAHEIDFSGIIMTTEEHQQRFSMTDIIAERQFVLFRLAGSPPLSRIADERPLRFAFVENAPAERAAAAVTEPGSYEPVWVRNASEAYEILKNGEADAFFASNNNDALFIEYEDVIIEDFFPLIFNPVSMATANPALESIISVVTKAQQNGADAYLSHMYNRAYQDYQKHKLSVRLTDEEREFIRNNPNIPVIAISSNYPVSFYNARENEWQGIFFDLLKEIEALTDMSFDIISEENTDWFVLLDMLKNKEASLIGELLWTRAREEHFIWTETVILHDSYALISMEDHHNVTINEIRRLRVGLARDTGYTAMFRQWFPEHEHTVEFDSIEETFVALRNGEVDLVMTTERRLMYLTHFQELTGYKLNYLFDQNIETRFGLHKDDTVLRSIIDKALQSIDTKGISNQWMHRTFDYRLKVAEARVPWMIGISISFAFIIVLVLFMFFISRRAAKQHIKTSAQNVLQLTKLDLMIKAARIGLWDMEILGDDPVHPDNVFLWSTEFRQMLGYENEIDFPNVLLSLRNVIHPDDIERSDKAFADHVFDKTGKTPFDVEYRLMKKDGEYSYFHACGEAIRDNDGNAIHIAGALIDITEAKKMEQQNAATTERLMLMLDTSPLCAQIWDKNLNTMDCNEAAVRLYGFKNKQEYKEKFITSCSPEYQPDGERSDEKAVRLVFKAFNEGYCVFEWLHKMPNDDTLIPAEVTLVRAKYGDEDVVIGYTRDLREHKAYLAEIEETQEAMRLARDIAEDANKSKSIFIANMSHEIRTPMNSIIGFSELAQDAGNPKKTNQYLTNISDNAKWLLNIINDILDSAKIESGKIVLEHIPFNLEDVIAQCQSAIMPKFVEKGLALYCYSEPLAEEKLLGDPVRLRQVIMNLLSNAAKFTNTGTVKLLTSIMNSDDKRATIKFEVKDSGIGMTSEQITKIFEPFLQADDSVSRKFGGTGLGLSITKSIIELMGGELGVESTPEIGSRFSFDLTFDLIAEGDTPTQKLVLNDIDKPTFNGEILVCEDNGLNQQVICEHLRRVGIKTTVAQNGQECLDIIAERTKRGKKPFDLIFMDIHMPVMDGLETSSQIIGMGIKTPIVALTANIMSNDLEHYKKSGMFDYLGKPFTSQELWKCLIKYFTVLGVTAVDKNEQSADDEKSLLQLRIYFVKNNKETHEKIIQAAESGDIKLAHRLVHTLKGNAGQIGEKRLQKIAAEVEDMLSDGTNRLTDEKVSSLEAELAAVLERLEPLLIKAGTQSKPEADTNQAWEILKRLEPILVKRKPECMKMLDEIHTIPGAEELAHYVEDFEFAKALIELSKLKERLGK